MQHTLARAINDLNHTADLLAAGDCSTADAIADIQRIATDLNKISSHMVGVGNISKTLIEIGEQVRELAFALGRSVGVPNSLTKGQKLTVTKVAEGSLSFIDQTGCEYSIPLPTVR